MRAEAVVVVLWALAIMAFLVLLPHKVARVDCAPEIVEIVVPESDKANFTY